MAEKTEPMRLPRSLLREVRKLAQEEGTSVSQVVNVAVAEKTRHCDRPACSRSGRARADVAGATRLLRRFGAGKAPLPGDEIEAPKAQDDLIFADNSRA